MPRPLVLATTNRGKAREFAALLALHPAFAPYTLTLPNALGIALPPVDETGTTFATNALLKACAAAQATGCAALGDDSGLCVDALGGGPGLHSARWAGPEADDSARTVLLLARLADVPAVLRTARFACALCLALPDGQSFAAEGVCEGEIIQVPQGADGFGYDPVFLLPQWGRTMAQLTPAEKNSASHRAWAVASLAAALANK